MDPQRQTPPFSAWCVFKKFTVRGAWHPRDWNPEPSNFVQGPQLAEGMNPGGSPEVSEFHGAKTSPANVSWLAVLLNVSTGTKSSPGSDPRFQSTSFHTWRCTRHALGVATRNVTHVC